MPIKEAILFCSILTLVWVGFYYGYKFLKLKNFLLGFELWIIGFSAANMFIYTFTGFEISGLIALFCDAFSRAIGVPVIAFMGMLKAINGYEPSKRNEILLFVLGAIVAAVVLWVPSVHMYSVYLLLIAVLAYCLASFWFVLLLLKANKPFKAVLMVVANLLSMYIAVIYDIAPIEGGENNVFFNFYNLAHLTWAFGFAMLYYAYVSIAEARSRDKIVQTRFANQV